MLTLRDVVGLAVEAGVYGEEHGIDCAAVGWCSRGQAIEAIREAGDAEERITGSRTRAEAAERYARAEGLISPLDWERWADFVADVLGALADDGYPDVDGLGRLR